MIADIELLPCPFCGGPVKLEEAESTRSHIHGERRWWGVVCRNTMNRGGTCAIVQRPSASEEAAIERWNRRATPQAPTPAAAEGQAEPFAWIIARDSDNEWDGGEPMMDKDEADDYMENQCLPGWHLEALYRGAPLPRQAAVQANTDKLLSIIACAYQIAGAHDAPAHILDVLSDPEAATVEQVEAMLPYQPGLVQAVPDIPVVLFDGNAVFAEVRRKVGKHFTDAKAVSDVLDAAVRLIRAAAAAPGEPGQ